MCTKDFFGYLVVDEEGFFDLLQFNKGDLVGINYVVTELVRIQGVWDFPIYLGSGVFEQGFEVWHKAILPGLHYQRATFFERAPFVSTEAIIYDFDDNGYSLKDFSDYDPCDDLDPWIHYDEEGEEYWTYLSHNKTLFCFQKGVFPFEKKESWIGRGDFFIFLSK